MLASHLHLDARFLPDRFVIHERSGGDVLNRDADRFVRVASERGEFDAHFEIGRHILAQA